MPHIHKLIDFTVGALIVHKNRILLVHHRKLNRWLFIGGHIELNEDIEEALFREILEESSLKKGDLEILGKKPKISDSGRKILFNPSFTDIHKISGSHRHIGLYYIMRSKSSMTTLAKTEHHAIRWLTRRELYSPKYKISSGIRFYAKEALRLVNTRQ